MTTLSAHARTAQDLLNKTNGLLIATRVLAHDIGLAPFRIAHITKAIADNQHAWQELNEFATALELTGEPRPKPTTALPTPSEG